MTSLATGASCLQFIVIAFIYYQRCKKNGSSTGIRQVFFHPLGHYFPRRATQETICTSARAGTGLSEARQHSEPREAMTVRAGILITDSSGRSSTFVFPFSHSEHVPISSSSLQNSISLKSNFKVSLSAFYIYPLWSVLAVLGFLFLWWVFALLLANYRCSHQPRILNIGLRLAVSLLQHFFFSPLYHFRLFTSLSLPL